MKVQKIDLKNNPKTEIVLNSAGEETEIFAYLNSSENFDGFLKIIHSAEETVSKITVKIVAEKGANINFSGIVKVLKGAKKADSELSIKVLMLCKEALVKALPVVEVEEDDVKAGHGLTISGVPEKELFYLMARGIRRRVAKNLVKEGFLDFAKS